ncbi:PAS/PAC sensor protein [Natronococcus amylolyticus DSM 10524]|uniref:histidine kinase n=1 Tax=Natronococcus amylolyticus DSM 10524 TaxID=1227497 RepID=L9WZ23_9EURY|nr:PAS/PAC sensor protein [Natronococcus amylolyticus DSM 10524]
MLEAVDALGPPSTPVTTPEVAEGFDCTQRTIYNRLDSLVDAAVLETKKVGANSRVWWRPIDGIIQQNGGTFDHRAPAPLRNGRTLPDSEMTERILEFDWAETSLGPIEEWPPALRTAVDVMLGANEAIGIYWGDDLRLLYNDLARDLIGEKHPEALGKPGRDVFPEAWDTLGPLHEQVLAGEGATRLDEFLLPIERTGEIEDVWWDTSYNPIPLADGSIGGVFNVTVDVTERVQAKRELCEFKRKSEARYRTLFESIDEGFCIIEMLFDEDEQPVDYRFLETNPRFEAITDLADAEGKRMRALEPAHEKHWFEIYGTVARTGEPVRFMEQAEHLGGRWYDVYAFRIGDPDERQVAILFEDITERKQTEKALRENEARLDAFVAATSEVVYRMSPDWSGMYELEGKGFIPDTEEPQRTWLDEYIPDEQERVEAAITEAIETKSTFELEHQVLQVDGTRGWTHSRAVPLLDEDGDIIEWFGTATDITERKQRQKALRKSEQRLTAATNAAEIGIWELDLQTDEGLYTSPRYAEILGYDEMPDDWNLERALEHYHPDDRERLATYLEEGLGKRTFEGRIVRPDGEQCWISVESTVYEDGDGTPVRAVGTILDITERKKRERKQAYQLKVNDALRPLTDPAAIQKEACRVLGEHLDVKRSQYGKLDLDRELIDITRDYYRGENVDELPSLVGEYSFDDFPAHAEAWLEQRSLVVNDAERDAALSEVKRAGMKQREVRATLSTPLVKNGVPVVVMAVTSSVPRQWTEEDIALLEETAERTWDAVQRAQAEQDLRESEARFRNVFENDMVPMAQWMQDGQVTDANEAFLDLLGYTHEELEAGELDWADRTPDEYHERDRAAIAEVEELGSCEPYEKEFIHKDGHRIPIFIGGGEFDQRSDENILFAIDITERKEIEEALRESEARLTAELEAIERLQDVSTQSIEEHEGDVLYGSVLETAMDLLDAGFGTIQRLDPQPYELDMLSYRGFTAETISRWDRVDVETSNSCGKALQTEERVIIPDVETCEFIEAGDDLEAFTRVGIRSMQSTPLVSRSGELLGMLSTHWTDPHEPSERDLHLLDVIARQVADLMEQRAAYETVSESEASLQRLNAATQELIDAEPATIATRVAPLVREVLDVEYAALWQYNTQRGDLEARAADVSPAVDGDALESSTEIAEQAWETFVGTDIVVANDLDASPDATSILRSRAFVSLGRHGVVCLGSAGVDTFDERTIDLVETVASTVETAWDRAESEAQLEQRNEELTRLDRLNSLIREIDTSLVEAETVDAIDDAVCERLVASPRYEVAWVGEFDAEADAVQPRSWAGTEASTIEELAAGSDDPAIAPDPFVSAIRTGEMQVIEDIATDARSGSWREVALKRGARSCFSIPLTYDKSVYGVLVVYGNSPARNLDPDVLVEFGRTIAHTINAVETRDTFQADSIVELTLRSTEADTPLCRLARGIDHELEFEGLVPGTDDAATVFFSVPDVAPERVMAAGEDVLGIEDVVSLAEHADSSLFKARLSESGLAALVLEQNATVRSLRIDAGTATVVVDLPGSTSVRTFVDALTREAPDLELLSRRTRTREPGTTLQTAVLEQLTPRQQEVLQLAYRSGYFEMPRVRTGKELADALNIVPSTFARHIRSAERNLLDVLFANGNESSEEGAQ